MYVCIHTYNGSSCGSINKHALKRKKKKKPGGALTKMRILTITWNSFMKRRTNILSLAEDIEIIVVSAFKFLKDLRWVSLSRVQLFVTPWTATCQALYSPLSPRVCSNSCPQSWQCYLAISFCASIPSFCFQSFPASGSFPLSRLFASAGQSIRIQIRHQSFQWILRVDFL